MKKTFPLALSLAVFIFPLALTLAGTLTPLHAHAAPGYCDDGTSCDTESTGCDDGGDCMPYASSSGGPGGSGGVVYCSTSADCASGQVCDASTGQCAEAGAAAGVVYCSTTADCGANQVCDASTGQCANAGGGTGVVYCSTSADCVSGQVCDASTGQCAVSGTGGSLGQYCNSSSFGNTCPSGTTCNAAISQCVSPTAPSCSGFGSTCPGGYTCNSTISQCVPNSTSGLGGGAGPSGNPLPGYGGSGGQLGGGPSLNVTGLASFETQIVSVINTLLVPLLIAVAFIVFLWGVFNYFILGGANEEKRAQGRVFVLYGILGFVIIISVWGLVNVVANFFNLTGQTHPAYPTL